MFGAAILMPCRCIPYPYPYPHPHASAHTGLKPFCPSSLPAASAKAASSAKAAKDSTAPIRARPPSSG